MRVLVVDDSAVMRRALSALIASDPSLTVVDTARDGQDALEKIKRHQPEVVTLDIEMPVMDGLAALEKIRAMPEPRPAVIMCSTLTSAGSDATLRALRLGAVDFIPKDPEAVGGATEAVRKDLIAKIKAVAPRARLAALKSCPIANPSPLNRAPSRDADLAKRACDIVVIGSSTGGPPILEQVLGAIPAGFTPAIVVAQHMPALFTQSMAARLRDICKVPVLHAEQDTLLQSGHIYITQGGKHSRVHRVAGDKFRVEISLKPENALYKPCVNELFASAADACKSRCVGVMLTGMGDDGCIGAKKLHAAGGLILAQLGETCAVYGMPRAVVEANIVQAALTPAQIGQSLASLPPTSFGVTKSAA